MPLLVFIAVASHRGPKCPHCGARNQILEKIQVTVAEKERYPKSKDWLFAIPTNELTKLECRECKNTYLVWYTDETDAGYFGPF